MEYGLKVLVRYHFQWRKTIVGWLQSATWKKRHRVKRLKSIALLRNCKMKSKIVIVVLKCKKCFFLRKLTKMFNLILCFSEFLKFFFVFGWCRLLFYLRTEKKFSVWSSVLFTVPALEMCDRKHVENRRDQSVCPPKQGLRFRAWPIHTGITVHCLIILCKYLSLSYKTSL